MIRKSLRWFVYASFLLCLLVTESSAVEKPDEKPSDAPATLIEMMSSKSPWERAYGANKLGEIALLGGSAHKADGKPANTEMSIAELQTKAIPHLMVLLRDDTDYSKDREHCLIPYAGLNVPTPGQEAARTLARIGKSAVQPLVCEVKDGTPYSRQMAVHALGELKTSGDKLEVVEALGWALGDAVPVVRAESAKALGIRAGRWSGKRRWMNSDMRIPKYLMPRLNDNDSMVRYEVARALGYSNCKTANDPLLAVMVKDGDVGVRAGAAFALGELDDPRAISTLLEILLEDQQAITALRMAVAEREDPDPKWQAAHTLAAMTDERAFTGLSSIIERGEGDTRGRIEAVDALERAKDPRVADVLLVALHDKEPSVRAWAARGFGMAGRKDTRAVEPLIALLTDLDVDVRRSAARVLGDLNDSRAAVPLAKLLSDLNRDVRFDAEFALKKLEKASHK